MQIAFVSDVVALEDAARLVATDEHSYLLRHPGTGQIADAGAPQILKQAVDAGFFRRVPSTPAGPPPMTIRSNLNAFSPI